MSEAWFAAPGGDRAIGRGARDQNRAAVTALLDCLTHRRGIEARLEAPFIRPRTEAGPVLCCRTSGSSGRVKTIRRSQASWIASFEVNRDLFGLSDRDVYGVLGQLGHSLALYATLEALHLGAGLRVLAGDSPRAQARQLAEAEVSVLYATPTQLRQLGGADAGSLPSVRHVFCGGGAMDPAGRAELAELCPGARLREFYGASETSFIAIADADTPEGSVGRAYPGARLEIRDGGEIWVAGPYLFDGYDGPNAPEVRRDGDFVSVGDLGHLDAAGYLFLRGRLSRMVKVADQNLSLDAVEAVLAASGAAICAAVAVPDARRGQAVVAVIEGPPDEALASRLRRACRDTLGAHAGPRFIRFVPRMPLLASGKPDLVQLARSFGGP